jgi:hypothetical protein
MAETRLRRDERVPSAGFDQVAQHAGGRGRKEPTVAARGPGALGVLEVIR